MKRMVLVDEEYIKDLIENNRALLKEHELKDTEIGIKIGFWIDDMEAKYKDRVVECGDMDLVMDYIAKEHNKLSTMAMRKELDRHDEEFLEELKLSHSALDKIHKARK